jgi:hypothetical protein
MDMSPTQFHASALDLLRSFWRIKAANAIYRKWPQTPVGILDYSNVPTVGLAANSFASESVSHAISALERFFTQRLPRDLLLALIAEFESRLVARLTSLGEREDGPLGELLKRIQVRITLPRPLVQEMNEVKARRNAMIHNGDKADKKYVTAACAVLPRAAPYVTPAKVGDNVRPTASYLTYAADVMVRYSNAIG